MHDGLDAAAAMFGAIYRAGRIEEAAKVPREGMSLHVGGAFHGWLFCGLAEHRSATRTP
jgi:hypothetical protein